jgi:hypothetical protein
MVKKAHTEQGQTFRLSQFFLYARKYRPENSGYRDREAGEKETKKTVFSPLSRFITRKNIKLPFYGYAPASI